MRTSCCLSESELSSIHVHVKAALRFAVLGLSHAGLTRFARFAHFARFAAETVRPFGLVVLAGDRAKTRVEVHPSCVKKSDGRERPKAVQSLVERWRHGGRSDGTRVAPFLLNLRKSNREG